MTAEFLYPLLYVGPKEQKEIDMPARLEKLVFKRGPLSEKGEQFEGLAYADVTEKEGRYIVKRFPDLFAWPEGTKLGPQLVTREEFDALAEVVTTLTEQVAALTAKTEPKGKAKTEKEG